MADNQAWAKQAQDGWLEMLARVNHDVAESINQLLNTEKAFKEQMKLRSSVKYWLAKAREHQTRAHAQKGYIAAYAAIAAIVSYIYAPTFFGFAKATAIELGERSATPLLILSGASIVAVSIVLWGARMLVRVYLDERHRALDAAERAVMAETYCALTNEDLVSEAERILVLSSLFRPSGESNSKDEGPDTLQHAILAKLLDGKPVRP